MTEVTRYGLEKIVELTNQRQFALKKNIYRETLRQLISIFGNVYYQDSNGNLVRVKCTTGKQDRVTGKDFAENNLVLPYITVVEKGTSEPESRKRNDNILVNEVVWDDKEKRAKRVLSVAPKAVNINYEINIWAKFNSDLDQIRYGILSLFNPALNIKTNYSDFTKAFIKEENDIIDQKSEDTSDRLVQKTISITVETYLPSPKFLFTNTGEIQSFNFDVSLQTGETEQTILRPPEYLPEGSETGSGGGGGGVTGPLTLSGSLDDVQIVTVEAGQVLAWNGSNWVASSIIFTGGGGGGVTDHGQLTGLYPDNDHPQYVLSSTNLSLSSSIASHIASSTVHFTSGSLSGAYVLTSTNSALSSLVNNHIGSAVHWELSTLNQNYINASGDSANAGFYLSSVSATNLSATNYYNLPSSTITWLEAQDIVLYVKSNQLIPKGAPVTVVSGTGSSSDIPLVQILSSVNNHVPEAYGLSNHVAGLAQEEIAAGGFGHIIVEGLLTGYDTNTPGWQSGDFLYVSSNGQLSNQRPPAPYESHPVGIVIRKQQNNGSILVKIENSPEINDIVGFNLSPTLINGDIITYDLTTSTFVNKQTINVSGQGKFGSVSATTYLNLPISALSGLSDVDVGPGNIYVSAALVWNGTKWTPSSFAGGGGGGTTDHQALTLASRLNDLAHPQYASSSVSAQIQSVSAYASSVSSVVSSHISNNSIHFTSGSLSSYYAASSWTEGRYSVTSHSHPFSAHDQLEGIDLDNAHPQYVLVDSNSNLSSLVSSHIASASVHFTSGSLSGAYVLTSTNNNLSSLVTNLQASTATISSVVDVIGNVLVIPHITDPTIHFTSGSLSGAYVLTSTNSNLSSLVSNHIASASVHFTSGSLSSYYAASSWVNSNYSLTSHSHSFSALSGLSDVLINSNPSQGQSLVWSSTKWVPSSVAGGGGANIRIYDITTYGAVGDGVTNDGLAISAAIEAAYNAGGGTVFFPAGTYLAQRILVKTGVNILGANKYKSIVKKPAVAGSNTSYGISTSWIHSIFELQSKTSIENIFIDGNVSYSDTSGTAGICAVDASGFHIKNVIVSSMGGNGMQFYGAYRPILENVEVYNSRRVGTSAGFNNEGVGLFFWVGDIAYLNNDVKYKNKVSIINCVSNNNDLDGIICQHQGIEILGGEYSYNGSNPFTGVWGANGIYVIGNTTIYSAMGPVGTTKYDVYPDVRISKAKARGNKEGGIAVAVSGAVIEGNICYENEGMGIWLQNTQDTAVINNICFNNGYVTNNTKGSDLLPLLEFRAGISMFGYCRNITIANNAMFENRSLTATYDSGARMAGQVWGIYANTERNSSLETFIGVNRKFEDIHIFGNSIRGAVSGETNFDRIHYDPAAWQASTIVNERYIGDIYLLGYSSMVLSSLSATEIKSTTISATTYLNVPGANVSGSTASAFLFNNNGTLSATDDVFWNPNLRTVTTYKLNNYQDIYSQYYNGVQATLNTAYVGNVSATTYLNLPSSVSVWNASAIINYPVVTGTPNSGDILYFSGTVWNKINISYGTAAPSNGTGNNGDIYLQYS